MAKKIPLPALSPTMEVGRIARWLVSEGEHVEKGQAIVEVETDKAVMEVPAPDSGILHIVRQVDSEDIPLGEGIGWLLEKGEAPPALKVASSKTAISEPPAVKSPSSNETSVITIREALDKALFEEMERDSHVIVLGEEVARYQGAFKVTKGLLQTFGSDRIFDTPISEYGFTGMAIGAAMTGIRPVVEYMTFNFSLQAIEQIVDTAAKIHYMSGGNLRAPVVFRGPNGSSLGSAAQHSQDLSGIFAAFPGLIVVAPSTPEDAKGLLKSSIRSDNPVVFLEHELIYGKKGPVPESSDWLVPLGKARTMRTGSDLTILSYSYSMYKVLPAAEALAQKGIEAEVIDLRTLAPLDMETISSSVQKTHRVLFVGEECPFGGVAAEVAARISHQLFDWLDAPVERLGQAAVPLPYAQDLETAALPQVETIVQRSEDLVKTWQKY